MRSIACKFIALPGLAVLAACSPVPLPSNVTTTTIGSASYIGSVDFSYQSANAESFSQLKLCVAENINNNAVSLQDSAGSIAVPGNYYQTHHSQVFQGSGIFKYTDEPTSTLVALGTVDGGPVALGLTRDFVRFDLKANVSGNAITLRFLNISRAQQNTGSSTNDGFGRVGVWPGSRSDEVYAALEGVANGIKTCLH